MKQNVTIDFDNVEKSTVSDLEGLRNAILHTLKARFDITVNESRVFTIAEIKEIKLAFDDLTNTDAALGAYRKH